VHIECQCQSSALIDIARSQKLTHNAACLRQHCPPCSEQASQQNFSTAVHTAHVASQTGFAGAAGCL